MEKERLLDDENFMYVIVSFPKNAVNITFDCDVYNDGEITKLGGEYDTEAIREARNMYLELDPDDCAFDVWRLSDKALEELRNDEI